MSLTEQQKEEINDWMSIILGDDEDNTLQDIIEEFDEDQYFVGNLSGYLLAKVGVAKIDLEEIKRFILTGE